MLKLPNSTRVACGFGSREETWHRAPSETRIHFGMGHGWIAPDLRSLNVPLSSRHSLVASMIRLEGETGVVWRAPLPVYFRTFEDGLPFYTTKDSNSIMKPLPPRKSAKHNQPPCTLRESMLTHVRPFSILSLRPEYSFSRCEKIFLGDVK